MFLNLIIYSSNNEYYEKMKIAQREYLKIFKNVLYFFISYNNSDNNTNSNEIRIVDDEIILNGVESLVPGILEKTLKSIITINMNFHELEYKYLIRSNISTVIDFNKLEKNINDYSTKYPQIPLHYAGGYSEVLQWIDIPSGITDRKYWGIEFVQGTNIVLSKFAVDNLIADYINRNELIDMTIVDDVAIALYFARNHSKFKSLSHHMLPNCYKSLISTPWNIIIRLPGFVFINPNNTSMNNADIYNISSQNWCFRHKTSLKDRKQDYLALVNSIKMIKING